MTQYHNGLSIRAWLFCSLLLSMFFTFISTSAVAQERYIALEPEFVVNYGNGEDTKIRYVAVNITLKARNDLASIDVIQHSDALRHAIIMTLSRQSVETMHSAQAQAAMRNQLLDAVQGVMLQETGDTLIDQVLFTSFVLQS
ncbi:flagellar basal body-associated FliL family protein [Salinibius halmophilus]|uniref:flagellar basal body-associated FliL family protein n=1 Tax=Salinibius halmophilus TaxID=1853216 RepID=UPI000E675AE0|nr:flagellar basal body-associated FliL family protein [Salinibius halmophilus]